MIDIVAIMHLSELEVKLNSKIFGTDLGAHSWDYILW